MTLQKIVTQLSLRLCSRYEKESATVIAWYFLEAFVGITRTDALCNQNRIISEKEINLLNSMVTRHLQEHEPLQYLIGSVPFLSLTLTLRPPILIPRPETEEWVAGLIEKLKKLQFSKEKKITILDLCTGSGCIGLAIAHALPNAEVTLLDTADHAIKLAQENAHKNNVVNVQFLQGNLFEPLIASSKKFDLIVSNPPYITEQEWHTLDPEVKDWEDYNALVAPENGLGLIKKIITQAGGFLHKKTILTDAGIEQLWLEYGADQGKNVLDFCHKSGYSNARIQKDLAHKDRIIMATPDQHDNKNSFSY
jgi:release factor glutamine methyltransferase